MPEIMHKNSSLSAGGRPQEEQKVAELARSYTTEAIDTLVALMRHGKGRQSVQHKHGIGGANRALACSSFALTSFVITLVFYFAIIRR